MADDKSDLTKELAKTKKTSPKVDKRLYDTLWGEVGGGPLPEVAAATSVFINRINKDGYERALKGSVAYNKKSPEYKKASTGTMNATEKALYNRNKIVIDKLVEDPALVQPYTHFENVNVFGEPEWAKKAVVAKDIGRQRFYVLEE